MPRWSRPPAPQTNWFALATAITAVAVVFCGGGLGGSEPVGGQTELLTLTLSAPQICETTPGGEAFGVRLDSSGRSEHYSVGWFVPGEAEVRWMVSGGVAPYALTIDGETRDGAGAFRGVIGTGIVSCALAHGPALPTRGSLDTGDGGSDSAASGRYFAEEPEVDSGLKTIVATVTDATGATAEASVDIHVILELGSGGDVLEAGKTYRVFGGLVTVPEGIDLEILGGIAGDGGETLYLLGIVGSSAHIGLTERTPHREVFRRVPSDGASGAAGGEIDLHAKFDELVASVGRAPSIAGRSK